MHSYTSLLFNGRKPQKLTGELIIQTTGQKGISLKLLVSELVEMNGREVAIGLYEVDKNIYCDFISITATNGKCLLSVRESNEGYARELFSGEL